MRVRLSERILNTFKFFTLDKFSKPKITGQITIDIRTFSFKFQLIDVAYKLSANIEECLYFPFSTVKDHIAKKAKKCVLLNLALLPKSIWTDFGSNEIHVTTLQYSVTFLVLSVVFNYISDIVLMYLFNNF
jgi:hypothetical protein